MFLNTADYVETISDLEKLRILRAAYLHVRTLEVGVAHIAAIEGAAIFDAISSLDSHIRELTDKLNAFDAGQEWFHGRAVKVA